MITICGKCGNFAKLSIITESPKHEVTAVECVCTVCEKRETFSAKDFANRIIEDNELDRDKIDMIMAFSAIMLGRSALQATNEWHRTKL